jgi:ATP-dependent exoDNAse (exonuclease V) beta subunit
LAFDEESKKELEPLAAVERLSEDARLTYVALTRAKHRCYVVAFPVIDNGKETFAGDFHRSTLAYEILGKSETHDESELDDADYCLRALEAAKNHGPNWSAELGALVDANSETMQADGLAAPSRPTANVEPEEAPNFSPRRFSAASDRLRSPACIASFSGLVQSSSKTDRERPDHDAVAMTPKAGGSGEVEDVFAFECSPSKKVLEPEPVFTTCSNTRLSTPGKIPPGRRARSRTKRSETSSKRLLQNTGSTRAKTLSRLRPRCFTTRCERRYRARKTNCATSLKTRVSRNGNFTFR